MKIIVPIRAFPDTTRPIRVTVEGAIDVVRWVISTADESAVDEAVRLTGNYGEVVAVSTREEYLLSALARGATRGVLIEHVDQLVDVLQREQADLILMGADNGAGARLAGALGIPQATRVETVDAVDGILRVERRLAKSREILELTLPALMTLVSITPPQLISLYAIVDAREKPIEHLSQTDSSVPAGLTVVEATTVPSTRVGRMVGSVDELVTALREEARVL